jgi:hypothetical protein
VFVTGAVAKPTVIAGSGSCRVCVLGYRPGRVEASPDGTGCLKDLLIEGLNGSFHSNRVSGCVLADFRTSQRVHVRVKERARDYAADLIRRGSG